MDFVELVRTQGIWAALALSVGYAFFRDLKGQIRSLQERNRLLEDAAKEAVQAKNEEIREWKTRALEGGRR